MKPFADPKLEIVRFDLEDVITSSGGGIVKPGDIEAVNDGLGWY